MNDQQRRRTELFAANYLEIKKWGFKMQNPMLKRLAALLYAAENRPIDCTAIRSSYDLLKANTGVFSMFRGNSAISIATMLSLSSNREQQLHDTIMLYDMMKKAKFSASDYLVIAAFQIAANTETPNYGQTIERARAFYEGMKAQHRFLTGRDDHIFASMLALSDIDVRFGVARMEELYSSLKGHFFARNGLQALTQVLVLGGGVGESIPRLLALKEGLRNWGVRLDREDSVSTLGVLTMLPSSVDEIVRNISETYEYLRTKKGFGSLSVYKQELVLFAAALVAYNDMDDLKTGVLSAAVSTSLTNIIIAQQTAMAVAAATSASAASAAT